jgi:hypothetical protein
MVWSAAPLLAGCSGAGEVALELGFARQAQTSASGLPPGVASLEVEVRRGSLGGELLDDSGCLAVGQGQRTRLVLDLAAGQGLVLVVKAWESPACTPAERPPWLGMSLRMDIIEGRETTVPVFVTRRGWRRNFARQELAPALGFASATRLNDGRVLIAGGVESVEQVAGGWRLLAGNRAWLYQPGSGRLEAVGRLSESRAAHRALVLSDGRVVLAGGAREMLLRYQPQSRLQLLEEGSPAGVDIFDPRSSRFQLSYLPRDMERTDAAWTVDGSDRIYALGGRTALARSDEVWRGEPVSGYFQWTLQNQRLAFTRRGAEALVMDDMLLVAGGALPGQSGLEAAGLSDLAFEAVAGTEDYAGLVGATFHAVGRDEAWLCGGISAEGLEEAVRFVLQLRREQDGFSLELGKLIQARAYHQAQFTAAGLLLAGGVGEGFAWQKDLEVQAPGGGEFLLEDQLSCASLGMALAELEEGSLLVAGGLGLDGSGQPLLCPALEIFSP